MSRFKRRAIVLAVCLTVAVGLYYAFGRSKPQSAFVPAEGTLLMPDGSPLTHTLLLFSPDEGNSAGLDTYPSALADQNGKFVIIRGVDEFGVPPGRYSVIVNPAMRSGMYNKLDKRYVDFATTPAKLVVPKGGGKDLTIQLEK